MHRPIYKLFVSLVILVLGSLSQTANAESYEALISYKAQAIHTSNPKLPFVAQGQPHKLAAALNALGSCQASHPTAQQDNTVAQGIRNSKPHDYCELVKLGDSNLTTSKQILSRVPKNAHPIYLWKYNSATATVYVAGSVHILKAGLTDISPQMQNAFNSSRNLVVEVDISKYTQEQIAAKAVEYARLPQGQSLKNLLSPKLYQQLDTICAQYGLPLAQMEQFKPSFVMQQLTLLAMLAVGYDPNQGLETLFVAQSADKNILELESLDLQFDLLMNQPLDTQVQILEDSIDQMSDYEGLVADMIVAWKAGDDRAFKEIFEQQSGTSQASKDFNQKLLGDRNVGMAKRIKSYLDGQGSYFVLIGAAHLVGEQSVIELLHNQGIAGQRYFSSHQVQR